MAQDVIMPKVGMYTDDIRLVEWLKDEGAPVKAGELLFAFETDKVTTEVEAEAEGFLHRRVAADSLVPIGGVVGLIAETREEYDALSSAPTPAGDEPAPAQSELFLSYIRDVEAPTPAAGKPRPAQERRPAHPFGRRAISPRARVLIREAGLPEEIVDTIPATGPGGRLIDQDVQAYLDAAAHQSASSPELEVAERIPLRGRRSVIARRMLASVQSTAQLTSVLEIEVSNLVDWRNRQEPKPGFTAIFVAIAGRALRRHPILNSRVAGDEIEVLADVNVAFAVDTEDGLLAPVVRGADHRPFAEIEEEIARLTARARDGSVELAELEGGTFTLSNSGTANVDLTTAILNPPQSAILWLGRIRERPVVADGAVVARPTVQACLTFDHRVVDGVPAAGLLGTFAELAARFPALDGPA